MAISENYFLYHVNNFSYIRFGNSTCVFSFIKLVDFEELNGTKVLLN